MKPKGKKQHICEDFCVGKVKPPFPFSEGDSFNLWAPEERAKRKWGRERLIRTTGKSDSYSAGISLRIYITHTLHMIEGYFQIIQNHICEALTNSWKVLSNCQFLYPFCKVNLGREEGWQTGWTSTDGVVNLLPCFLPASTSSTNSLPAPFSLPPNSEHIALLSCNCSSHIGTVLDSLAREVLKSQIDANQV